MISIRTHSINHILLVILFWGCLLAGSSTNLKASDTTIAGVKLVPVASGWAHNSVNTVVFRKNSLCSYGEWQFIAFYNEEGYVVLGKRKWNRLQWQLQTTPYRANVKDAHNSISIMVDGKGFLHMAWGLHNNPLQYVRGMAPLSLTMGEKRSMTGSMEKSVTYPEFYQLKNGNILFLYRDGGSGNGNIVLNVYDIATQKWKQLQRNLVDGEGSRNAYWQACTDANGTLHLSWAWRETPDVASNHDLCYARSDDGGVTWKRSNGTMYQLPITAATAEYAWHIPQQHELINQTSMYADKAGNPYIATYWREDNEKVPQYQVVYLRNGNWKKNTAHFRTLPFSLGGLGSKQIPIARPQIIVGTTVRKKPVAIIFRDEERGSRVSVAQSPDIGSSEWKVTDLTQESVGSWEPSFDTELWKNKHRLHLFLQEVQQVDGEGLSNTPPKRVSVLEWIPRFK